MYSRGRFDQRNLAWVDEGHRWHGVRSPHTLGIPGVLPSIESWNPQTLNLAWGDELIMLGWTGWKCQFSAVPPPANMFLESNFLLCSFTNISPRTVAHVYPAHFPLSTTKTHEYTRTWHRRGGMAHFGTIAANGHGAIAHDFWARVGVLMQPSINGDFPLPYLIARG